MSINSTAKSARRLARYLLLFEIFINAIQFGLIFVAIGHDANSSLECFGGAGGNIGAGGTCAGICSSPPVNNPNKCHVYIWTFPNDTSTIPPQGLFGNDTSYYFPFDPTNVVSYQMCVNVIAIVPHGAGPANDTLTLQYLNSSSLWTNYGGVGVGLSVGLAGLGSTCHFAQVTVPSVISRCFGLNGINCQFRIAGNCYEPVAHTQCYFSPGNPGFDVITISDLIIQFYTATKTVQGTITCTAVTRSLSAFTTNCVRTFSTGATQVVTVGWYATNATGIGACGVADNCIRGPATFTCTLSAVGNTCSVVTTYSPAFTGSIPIPILDWNPLVGITQTTSPPFIYNLLT